MNRAFTLVTIKKQNAPAISPIAIADIGDTNPDAGVMATRPATAPEIAPSALGFPLTIHSSRSIQCRSGRAKMRGDECAGGQAAGGKCAAGIESKPSHP